MTTEYGVRSRHANGVTFDSPVSSLAAARGVVERLGDEKCWSPAAEAVVAREVGPWRLLDETEGER
jgi:hypothetical protein